MLNVAHRENNNTTESSFRTVEWLKVSVWEKLPLIGRASHFRTKNRSSSNNNKEHLNPNNHNCNQFASDEEKKQQHNHDTDSDMEPAMEAQIWSQLPEDVIEKILARLPLPSVLRFRCVSRRWKNLLTAGSFAASSRPCFLLCTVGEFACAFDPSTERWLTLTKPMSPGSSVITAAGSLLCLGNQVTECRALMVCNPITRSLRQLPEMKKVCLIHKAAMVIEEEMVKVSESETETRRNSKRYRIMVAGERAMPSPARREFHLMTEIYDSVTGVWEMAGDPPSDAKFGSDPGVWDGSDFLCLTEMPYGVVKFDGAKRQWQWLPVDMPDGLCMPALAKAKNKVLMVGRKCVKPSNTTVTTFVQPTYATSEMQICIWELLSSGQTMKWCETVRLPADICRQLWTPSYSPFVCAGVGDEVFITTHLSPRVLVFHVASRHGSWLPSDPLFPRFRDFHLLGFPFEPRFDASP